MNVCSYCLYYGDVVVGPSVDHLLSHPVNAVKTNAVKTNAVEVDCD